MRHFWVLGLTAAFSIACGSDSESSDGAGGSAGSTGGSAGSTGGSAGGGTGGTSGSGGSAGATGGPIACEYPLDVATERLLYGCDIDSAADCRFNVPEQFSDPLCGDDDDWTLRFERSTQANQNAVGVPAPWTVASPSHGSITSMTMRVISIYPTTPPSP